MENERIEIIIREIEFWKENKLLPETQCDFLLALYTKGEYEKGKIKQKEPRLKRQQWSLNLILFMVSIIFLIPLSVVLTYFTNVNPYLQIVILSLFFIYGIYSFVKVRKMQLNMELLPIMISLFLFLILTIHVGQLFIEPGPMMNGIVLLNMVLWFVVSRLLKQRILLIISILGLFFVGVNMFL